MTSQSTTSQITCKRRFQSAEGRKPLPAASVHAAVVTRDQNLGPESPAETDPCQDPAHYSRSLDRESTNLLA